MSAPIDPADLAAARLPFGQSTMLPAAAYVSEAVLAWERRHLFAGSWTCLGRTATLLDQGNQHALTVGDIETLVTLTPQPRAFANICRHRAHSLLSSGTSCDRPAIVCPYHGWAYALDGSLRSAPRMDPMPAGHGLIELPCVDWHGWLFVNALANAPAFASPASPSAPSLSVAPASASYLGDLDRLVAPYAPASLVVMARHVYEVAANWKILVENYHECYHCPLIHPELCAVSPPASGNNWHEPGNWVGGSMDLRPHAVTMSRDGSSHGVMLPGADPRTVRYIGVFPNLLLSLHPDYVLTHRLAPLSPTLTRVECEWLFHQSTVDTAYAVDFWDLTNKQDWAACESVQRGVSSPHYRPGPLAPNENAVYDWLQLIATAYQSKR